MHPLTTSQVDTILNLIHRGFSYTQICAATGLSHSTISRVHSQYCSELPTHPPGWPSKLSSTSQWYLVQLVTGPQSLNATQAAKEVSRATGQPVHPKTASRTLRKQGLKAVVKQKKPFISPYHSKESLDFAYQHQHWTLEDWKLVIFSDETKINRLGSDGCSWV
jgi:transposase